MKIIAVKTKKGYYIKKEVKRGTYCPHPHLSILLLDGATPKGTFAENWCFVESPPKVIERVVCQKDINHRFEMIDPTMASEKAPLTLTRDEATYLDEDDDRMWRDKYAHLTSLYKAASDKQPDTTESIEFEFEIVLELDEITQHEKIDFPATPRSWSCDIPSWRVVTTSSVNPQWVDKMVFPDIVLPSRPCRLSSIDTYRIIRRHVQENIDGKYAVITSDHDFCFGVQRKIELTKTEHFTVDVNLFMPRRRPKLEKRSRNHRQETIFQMTHDEDNYKGYTPVKGFRGDNHTDLKKKINSYLKALMEFINRPTKECPKCRGVGAIVSKDKPPETPSSD